MCDSVSNACNTIGQYGAQFCTKLGEWGGAAGTWIVDTGSELALKVKDFIMTTAWPAIQQFWAWLTSLCGATASVAKHHKAEAGLIGAAGASIGAATIGSVWACFGGKSGNTKKSSNSNANNSSSSSETHKKKKKKKHSSTSSSS